MGLNPSLSAALEARARRHAELTDELSRPAGESRRVSTLHRELGTLERSAALWAEVVALEGARRDAQALLEEGGDADMALLAREELSALEEREQQLEARVREELARDEDLERTKVIVEIRAGVGGDEATLFCGDLLRIYQRFAENQRWRFELLDASSSEVGGFKDLSFALEGEGTWNLMRFESGGHRVQRVPATEAKGRIHTSAATVAVLPEAEEAEIDLADGDLRIDTMRAGGPGGQSVNTTSSAVRITHLPSGVVVQCQDEKSQLKNKAKAMRILRARLLDLERERLHAERSRERREQVGSGNRNDRVRTYNWPQNRVSDHRLDQNHSLEHVLGGKLGPLLEALADQDREERLARL
jgi:peptide chain release factor 1